MGKLLRHLKTIRIHRRAVRKYCFKLGIPIQGLLHDLSKYSLAELSICKYYTGSGSPHEESRRQIGYSKSWTHHYHKNKHHFQFWWDENEDGEIIPVKMPYKYVIESFCDMVGAGKAYMKTKWTVQAPWDYYKAHCEGKRIMNKDSEYLLTKLLWNLHEANSEKDFCKWYKGAIKYLKKSYLIANNFTY